MFLPSLHLWPHSQANPAPGRLALSKAPRKPSVGRSFPATPLPCNDSWGRATQGKDKGKMVFPCTLFYLCPLLSSLLPLIFSSSLSCLWTAACLSNDNIGALPLLLYSTILVLFVIFTLVHSLYVQSICNYLLLISPKSSAREVGMSALAAPLSRWTSQYREVKS